MVHRIANCLWQNFGNFLKLFFIGIIACDVSFFHTVRTHYSPLVAVVRKPYTKKVIKVFIFVNHLRAYVAVVVDNWLALAKEEYSLLAVSLFSRKSFPIKVFILTTLCLNISISYNFNNVNYNYCLTYFKSCFKIQER